MILVAIRKMLMDFVASLKSANRSTRSLVRSLNRKMEQSLASERYEKLALWKYGPFQSTECIVKGGLLSHQPTSSCFQFKAGQSDPSPLPSQLALHQINTLIPESVLGDRLEVRIQCLGQSLEDATWEPHELVQNQSRKQSTFKTR